MPAPDESQPPHPKRAELPSYTLEDDAPTGWKRWLRGWRLAVLLLAALLTAAAVLGAKPLYSELKARRALSIAEDAGLALDRGQPAEASILLRQAALMAFDDERVASRVTYHAARSGDMASVAAIGQKLDAGNTSAEETLVFGEMSLGARRLDDTRRALGALPPNLPAELAVRRAALTAGWWQAQENSEEAEKVLREALPLMPQEQGDKLRVMLANLLIISGNPDSATEAEQLLEQAAMGDGDDALDALRVLAISRAGLSSGAQEAVRETTARLRNHPASKPADELFIARLQLSSDPSRREEVVGGLVAQLRAREGTIGERVAAARWLVELSEYAAVLDLINPDEPSRHAGALMVRMDALGELNRWDEVDAMLTENRGGTIPDTLYHVFRARLAQERGETVQAENERRQLRQVMQFAEMPHVLFVARYAETCGWKPEAFTAWRILATDNSAKISALRGQLRNLPLTATAADGAAIAGELLSLQPADPSARLSAAYFRLLAGTDIESSSAVAEELLAADTESVDIRRVAAIARLRTGQPDKGLAILPDDGGEMRWKALHAALLRAAGQKDRAAAIRESINEADLSTADRELLRTD